MVLPSLYRPAALKECLAFAIEHSLGFADFITLGGMGGLRLAYKAVPMELIANYEIVGLLGDDVRIRTPGWDFAVCEALINRTGLVYGRDGFKDEKLCTHPFISSRLILRLGFIQPNELNHFYGDNYWMELLRPFNATHYLPDLVTTHMHWTAGKSQKDSTYEAAEKQWPHDTEAWAKYQRDQLPLDQQKISDLFS